MVQTSLTRFREVWRAQPSTKRPNPAPVPPECQVGVAEIEPCLTFEWLQNVIPFLGPASCVVVANLFIKTHGYIDQIMES